MQWPRKGIIIRVLVYGPLLAYFGWQAWQRFVAQEAAQTEAEAPETVGDELERHKKVITMPDGSEQEIYELTPEQAEEILGERLPEPPAPREAAASGGAAAAKPGAANPTGTPEPAGPDAGGAASASDSHTAPGPR